LYYYNQKELTQCFSTFFPNSSLSGSKIFNSSPYWRS